MEATGWLTPLVYRVTLIAYSFKFDLTDSLCPGKNNRCLATNFVEQAVGHQRTTQVSPGTRKERLLRVTMKIK